MDFLGILALILGVAGILGGFIPVLPGPPLSWVALLLVHFSDSTKDEISVSALIVWLVIATALTVLDYVLPGMLTKVTGGHKAAERNSFGKWSSAVQTSSGNTDCTGNGLLPYIPVADANTGQFYTTAAGRRAILF